MRANEDEGPNPHSVRARLQAARTEAKLFERTAPLVTAGRFVILERIGAGGMGVVYRAFDPDLERIVALKVLDRLMRSDAERIRKEARALARLNHPNVVAVYETGREGDESFLAMEFIDGGSLADWCRRHEVRDRARTRRLCEMLRQVSEGLAAAHRTSIVHRDLKPGNILVGGDGRVRIADFGLAALSGSAPAIDETRVDESPDTPTDGIAGTPAYMAPEQHEGVVGPKGDQFSLCVTFWEALSGRHPFRHEGMSLLEAMLRGKIRPERSLPTRVREVLTRGMSADPDARFPDVDALKEALTRRRWPRAAIVGALGVVSVAAVTLAEEAPPRCEVDEALLGSAWTESRQHALERAFVDADAEGGATAWLRVQHQLTEAVELWRGQNLEACLQSRDREPGLAEQGRRAQACSRRAAWAFRNVSETLLDADQRRVARALTASGVVRGLVDCEDGVAPESERAFELATRIDEALIAQALGDAERMVGRVTSILESTDPGEFPGLRATAHSFLATYYRTVEDYARERRHSNAGLLEAELADDSDRIAQAWGDLARLAARGQDFDSADFYLARAHRLRRQGRLSPGRVAGLLMTEGHVLAWRGEPVLAARAYGRAVEACRASRPGSVLLAWALSDQALQLLAAGELDAAVVAGEESESIMRAAAGEHHLDTAVARVRLGRVYVAAGRADNAASMLDRGLAILDAHPEAFSDERTPGRTARDRLGPH